MLYGRLPRDTPDHIVMHGGQGATKRHAAAVTYATTCAPVGNTGQTLLQYLDAAGFDTTTLVLSIRVKPPTP